MVVHLALVLGGVHGHVVLRRRHLLAESAVLVRVRLAPAPAVAATVAVPVAVVVSGVRLVLAQSGKAERVRGVVLSVDVRLRDVRIDPDGVRGRERTEPITACVARTGTAPVCSEKMTGKGVDERKIH